MLDPKILRENPDKIRKMLKDRGLEYNLDGLIQLDKQRRNLIMETDEFRKKRNEISLEIGKKKKASQDPSALLDEMKKVSTQLEELESKQNTVESDYEKLAYTVPLSLIHI